MARGKNVPPLIRRVILEEHKAGKSLAQIGRELQLNRQTIHRVIQLERAKAEAQADG